MARNLQEMPKMVLNFWSLSEVELLQFLTLNLCGGSRVKISHYIQPSNLSSALNGHNELKKHALWGTGIPTLLRILIKVYKKRVLGFQVPHLDCVKVPKRLIDFKIWDFFSFLFCKVFCKIRFFSQCNVATIWSRSL